MGAPQYVVELATHPVQHCDQEIYCVAREGYCQFEGVLPTALPMQWDIG